MLVQGLRFIHKTVEKFTMNSMDVICDKLRMSTADLFINLMPMEENLEFGGIKMIPIHGMNGKLVFPAANLKTKAGQSTYKMLIALRLLNISLGGCLVQVDGTQLDMLLASDVFLMMTVNPMKGSLIS